MKRGVGWLLGAASVLAVLAATSPAQAAPGSDTRSVRVTPDWAFTPGRLCTEDDPDFKEFRYPERIPYCRRNVTLQMKQEIAAHYGIPRAEWPDYEFDHLIPLALGGDSHVDNLWPQPHGNPDGSEGKDRLEDQLFKELSSGAITQAEAVRQIYAWFGVSPQIPVPARPAVPAVR